MIPISIEPKIIKTGDNMACFEISALYPGYGITIGNSLRRVLLSSLEGAAVTQVKIKGAQHEFSTIPGVLEDVIMIILSLKKMRFKVFSDESQKVLLKVNGEKEIKGSDFKLPSQVELINKDIHIATLTAKTSKMEMEIQIEKGTGYEPLEKRKKEKQEIGVIILDAIFTPIKKVSYKVENMRVGDKTDFDRLELEIETDGTITPKDAFVQASNILLEHFSLFSKIKKEKKDDKKVSVKKVKSKKVSKPKKETKKKEVKKNKDKIKTKKKK